MKNEEGFGLWPLVVGLVLGVVSFVVVYPIWSANATQKELAFQKEFFGRYQSYDDIVDDYLPDKAIRVEVSEKYPSGKVVTINHRKEYFVKKDMSYFVMY